MDIERAERRKALSRRNLFRIAGGGALGMAFGIRKTPAHAAGNCSGGVEIDDPSSIQRLRDAHESAQLNVYQINENNLVGQINVPEQQSTYFSVDSNVTIYGKPGYEATVKNPQHPDSARKYQQYCGQTIRIPLNEELPPATFTPEPTFTPVPTWTPVPTFTPVPTTTPVPTVTSVPSSGAIVAPPGEIETSRYIREVTSGATEVIEYKPIWNIPALAIFLGSLIVGGSILFARRLVEVRVNQQPPQYVPVTNQPVTPVYPTNPVTPPVSQATQPAVVTGGPVEHHIAGRVDHVHSGVVSHSGMISHQGEVPMGGTVQVGGNVPMGGTVTHQGEVPMGGNVHVEGHVDMGGTAPIIHEEIAPFESSHQRTVTESRVEKEEVIGPRTVQSVPVEAEVIEPWEGAHTETNPVTTQEEQIVKNKEGEERREETENQ